MSALLETVCIVNRPGITESTVVALARARLQTRGLIPAEVPRPLTELVELCNDAVKIWQVSFVVEGTVAEPTDGGSEVQTPVDPAREDRIDLTTVSVLYMESA
jgi:hypothetical protein